MPRGRKNFGDSLAPEESVQPVRLGHVHACKFDNMTVELVEVDGRAEAFREYAWVARAGTGARRSRFYLPAGGSSLAARGHDVRTRRPPRADPPRTNAPRSNAPRTNAPRANPPRAHALHTCAVSTRARSRWHAVKRTFLRFGDLLIVGIWLLSTVRVPTAMSAPLGGPDGRYNSKPKWINPCGGEPNAELFSADLPESRSSDGTDTGKPFESILLAARLAKENAQNFKEEYVQHTFNVGFNEWHDTWKSKHYDWLPSMVEIPKRLGEPTPQEHLEKLELDSSLKNIYKYLQMYAVGLEQITWDQEDTNGDFLRRFTEIELQLKVTLCEVQSFMMERNVRQHPDVRRSLMESSVRQNSNTSHRNLRDWLIYRDYMNGLEYVIEVLEHFESKYSSS